MDVIGMEPKMSLQDIDTIIFDLDGVVYRGNQARSGIKELLKLLENRGLTFHFLTNTSSKTSQDIATRLRNLGLVIPPSKITTAAEISISYLKNKYKNEVPIFTIGGGSGLIEVMKQSGIEQISIEKIKKEEIDNLVKSYHSCCPFLIGWTDVYNYEFASLALQLGSCISEVYSTDNGRFFTTEKGILPGTAWVSASIGCMFHKDPVGLGKPNRLSVEYVLNKIGKKSNKVLMIGDSVDTDISAGNVVGCNTVLLLGGITLAGELINLDKIQQPDLIINELDDLTSLLSNISS